MFFVPFGPEAEVFTLIPNEATKFDFSDRSLADLVQEASIQYRAENFLLQNLGIIEDTLQSGSYKDRQSIETHLHYISGQLNRLSQIKRTESEVFSANGELDSTISRLIGLNRQLSAKLSL
jgi:hypothetical protein